MVDENLKISLGVESGQCEIWCVYVLGFLVKIVEIYFLIESKI